MSDFGETEYKEVVVLAIHMLNVDELLFEMNWAIEGRKYQFFIAECVEILQGVRGLLDIVVYNGSVCGIYSVLEDMDVLQKIGEDIREGVCWEIDRIKDRDWTLPIYGVGIAVGTAYKINVRKYGQRSDIEMWLGNVLKRADVMAQMSICDGRGKVFVEK